MDLQDRPLGPGISFKAACVRAALYIGLVAVFMQGVFFEGIYLTESRFSESGLTEYLQSGLLALSSLLLAYTYLRLHCLRHVALLMFALLLASLVREQDAFLDQFVFDGAWQVLVSLIILPCLFLTLRYRQSFVREFARYADSFSFGLFAAGFLCTYVFSRLYGRSEFWESLMQEHYLRVFKETAEEVTELFGYMLLLFAVIELVLLARRLRHAC